MNNQETSQSISGSEILRMIKKEQENQTSIAKANEYMNWLASMGKEYWEQEEISVQKVGFLYEKIKSYCQKNYIEPQTIKSEQEYYLISFKGNIYEMGSVKSYEIGFSYQQRETHYFSLYRNSKHYNIANLTYAIDFSDILSDKLTLRAQAINIKKEEIENYLEDMLKAGVPHDVISTSAKRVLCKDR